MTDTPMRLAGPIALTTSAATYYTAPASTTAILRSIHVCNASSTAYHFTMSIGADATGTRLFHSYSIPPNGVLDWSGFLVLATGNIVQAWAQNVLLTFTMSGVEIT